MSLKRKAVQNQVPSESELAVIYVARRRDRPGDGWVAKCGDIVKNGFDGFDAQTQVIRELSKRNTTGKPLFYKLVNIDDE